jgi:hypothetical protein
MDVLAIGNSFSQDATRYLSDIAHAQGETLNVVNLYIGGCSLERHFRNMKSGERAYTLEFNGKSTRFSISLKEALMGRSREWDVITIQQASHESLKKEYYQPYLHALVLYIREFCPKAKLYLHETWGYAEGSSKLLSFYPSGHAEEMFGDVIRCYREVEKEAGFDGLIPSGELMLSLLQSGVEQIHRDGYHLTFGLGRYAAGLLWFPMLTGKSVSENTFSDFDEPICPEHIALAKRLVDEIKL